MLKINMYVGWLKGCVITLTLAVGGCVGTADRGAFDLDSQTTGAVDKRGFPVFLGPQYNRNVPLKRTIERAELESELQAVADSRKNAGIDVDKRRSELLQRRLQEIARTHGPQARAEIEAACATGANGVVTCKGD
ncbi:MAG: hypothetical protein AAFW47_03985 [Pseudomonadota bacterium]